ncbi:MAG: transcriptional repressor [Chloracidobacterium sp.]|nr:transcriptional repressor [Chloracidobacterium sp.]
MNIRNTKQRQAIFEAIERFGGHLTADEIYRLVKRHFPRLSLGTVYRNLRLLVAQGGLRELDFGMAVTYFETTKDSHYHLICRVCGSIADADIPVERDLQSVVGQARNLGGFCIEEHRLDFIGVCAACQMKPGKTNRNQRQIKSR